jgi:hypothetical protein
MYLATAISLGLLLSLVVPSLELTPGTCRALGHLVVSESRSMRSAARARRRNAPAAHAHTHLSYSTDVTLSSDAATLAAHASMTPHAASFSNLTVAALGGTWTAGGVAGFCKTASVVVLKWSAIGWLLLSVACALAIVLMR